MGKTMGCLLVAESQQLATETRGLHKQHSIREAGGCRVFIGRFFGKMRPEQRTDRLCICCAVPFVTSLKTDPLASLSTFCQTQDCFLTFCDNCIDAPTKREATNIFNAPQLLVRQ